MSDSGLGGTWNRAGTIVFATEAGVLTRTSAAGGPCTELAKPEPGVRRAVPVFLPDGDHFLYVLATADEARRGVYVASLGDPNGRRLLADQSSAVFVPNGPGSNQGRLLFVREQTLMAQAFDAASLQLSGEPVTVADQVSFTAYAPRDRRLRRRERHLDVPGQRQSRSTDGLVRPLRQGTWPCRRDWSGSAQSRSRLMASGSRLPGLTLRT